jgi:cytochrome d ubiquinol oxidase subunit II
MSLADLWFVLFVVIIGAYLILDGFDLGVGVLHPFVARDDRERRLVLNSIGPIWDGNEVWLVVGGGVLFAAFPIVYAALFSGFYGAMMLVLFCIILRTVAIEFRSKLAPSRWRSLWDGAFFVSSAGLALLLGVALGNIVSGVPIDSSGEIVIGGIVELLSPFALLVGVTTIAMVTVHGALYLNLKTEAELQARVRRLLTPSMAVFGGLLLASGVAAVVGDYAVGQAYRDQPIAFVVPAAGGLAFVAAWLLVRRGSEALALALSGAGILLVLASVAIGLYPNLLVSTIDPAYSLTTANASSADNTLQVLLVVAIIGNPFVLAYTAGVYYIFRGKVRLSPHSY